MLTGVNVVLMLYLFAESCIYDEMKYIFVDESGTPTIKDSRPFIVAVVIMASFEEVADIDRKISQLKKDNNISQEYEFHFSRNTNKRKNLFIKFLKYSINSLSFCCIKLASFSKSQNFVRPSIYTYFGLFTLFELLKYFRQSENVKLNRQLKYSFFSLSFSLINSSINVLL